MPRDQKKVEKGLLNKGFIIEKDSHHRYFTYYSLAGEKTEAGTYTSHGNKEIGDFLISSMSKQCCLSKKDFLDLVDCPLSRQDFEALLKDKGLLE